MSAGKLFAVAILFFSPLITLVGQPQEAPGYQALANKTIELANQGNYAEAVKTAREAHKVAVEFGGSKSWAAAVSGMNLGMLLQRSGKLAEADSVLSAAIVAAEAAPDSDATMIVSMKNIRASVKAQRGDLPAAEKEYRNNLTELRALKKSGTEEEALLLNDIAEVCRQQGKAAEADSLFKTSIAISEKNGGSDNVSLGYRHNSLGILYSDSEKFAEAASEYQKAIAIFENMLDSNSLDLATTRMNLGTSLFSLQRFDEADSLYVLALPAFEKGLGSKSVQVGQLHANLGLLRMTVNDNIGAEPELKAAIDILEAADVNHPTLPPLYDAYSVLLFTSKRTEEAAKYREKYNKLQGGQ